MALGAPGEYFDLFLLVSSGTQDLISFFASQFDPLGGIMAFEFCYALMHTIYFRMMRLNHENLWTKADV